MNIEPDRMLAIELASQCWMDRNTEDIQMDDRLANAFIKRLLPYIKELNAAREVAEAARKRHKFPCCGCDMCKALEKLDEARRG